MLFWGGWGGMFAVAGVLLRGSSLLGLHEHSAAGVHHGPGGA